MRNVSSPRALLTANFAVGCASAILEIFFTFAQKNRLQGLTTTVYSSLDRLGILVMWLRFVGIGTLPQVGRLTPSVIQLAHFPSRSFRACWLRLAAATQQRPTPEPKRRPVPYQPVSLFSLGALPRGSTTTLAGRALGGTTQPPRRRCDDG
jgi:hypothetical protein